MYPDLDCRRKRCLKALLETGVFSYLIQVSQHFDIWQASLSVYPEAVSQEPGVPEMSIKQESLEHGAWPGSTGSIHNSDLACRPKRVGSSIGGKSCMTAVKLDRQGLGVKIVFQITPLTIHSYDICSGVGSHQHQQHHQHFLQQSMSEDSLQDEPLHGR